MSINLNFSYNGFKPEDRVNLEALKSSFKNKLINYKDYTKAVSDIKRGFKHKTFLNLSVSEFNNSDIVNSNFSQEFPFTDVFPNNISNVNFVNCNLNNCNIPQGCTLVNCTNKHFELQNDGEHWVINNNHEPIEPLDIKKFNKAKLDTKPNSIPSKKVSVPISVELDPDIAESKLLGDIASNKQTLKDLIK